MKALSLFSGIGGIDLAAEWAGIETVAFCEREPFCQKVLAKHWPNIPIYDDVCTLTKERMDQDGVGTIELIHGGYPCQPFSLAGERKGENDDRHLWPEVFRLLQEIKPKWFVGENVAGHVTLGIDIVLSDLESIGYTWEAFIIPACAVNAPHRRERVFIVAHSEREGLEGHDEYSSAVDWENKGIQFGAESSFKDAISNPTSIRSQRQRELVESFNTAQDKVRQASESLDVRVREQWAVEPNVGRVAHGIPKRVDRLKSLGNAVVPQQIYPILAAIKQIDENVHPI